MAHPRSVVDIVRTQRPHRFLRSVIRFIRHTSARHVEVDLFRAARFDFGYDLGQCFFPSNSPKLFGCCSPIPKGFGLAQSSGTQPLRTGRIDRCTFAFAILGGELRYTAKLANTLTKKSAKAGWSRKVEARI